MGTGFDVPALLSLALLSDIPFEAEVDGEAVTLAFSRLLPRSPRWDGENSRSTS